jgi:ABC-type uncharacterized transport system YnjBCD permease subunit
MVASYIIVRCAPLYGADEAVFTGRMTLVEGPTAMATNIPWIMCEGETSPHIEHAIAFLDLFQATVWSDRLMRYYRQDRGRYDTQTWFVRNDGDFAIGENLHHKDAT